MPKTNPQTREPPDIEKAIYLLDHGWEMIDAKNQEENLAPIRYRKRNAFGMNNMLLNEAYQLEKGNNDLVASWQKNQ